MVQEEIKRRSEAGRFMRSVSPLSGRIICGDCGGFYGRKVWHSNTAYRSYAWHCNNKFTKRQYCKTPTVKTEAIEKCFIDAFNSLLERKEEIAENYRLCLSAITDDTALVKRKDALEKRILEETEKTKDFLFRRSKSDEDLNAVNSRYNEYLSGIEALQKERQEIVSQISLLGAKKENVKAFLKILRKRKTPLTEFDPLLWQTVVNHMVIYHDLSVKFILRDGSEIPWTIERGVRDYVDIPYSPAVCHNIIIRRGADGAHLLGALLLTFLLNKHNGREVHFSHKLRSTRRMPSGTND